MQIVIIAIDMPGRTFCGSDGTPLDNVHVAVQVRADPVGRVPGDAGSARWEVEVAVVDSDDGSLDFRGPAVHGKRGERFLYLTWGDVGDDDEFAMFRRAKLMLNRIDEGVVRDAERARRPLVATVSLTDERGGPRCARVDPPAIAWAVDSTE